MTSTDPEAPATPTSPEPTERELAPDEGRRLRSGYVTSYGGGRVCSMTGCATVLSIYNGAAWCSGHLVAEAHHPPGRSG